MCAHARASVGRALPVNARSVLAGAIDGGLSHFLSLSLFKAAGVDAFSPSRLFAPSTRYVHLHLCSPLYRSHTIYSAQVSGQGQRDAVAHDGSG